MYEPMLRESSSFPKNSYNSSITSTSSCRAGWHADELMDMRKGDIWSSMLYVLIDVLASLTVDPAAPSRLPLQLLANDNSEDVVVRMVARVEVILADLFFFSMKMAFWSMNY